MRDLKGGRGLWVGWWALYKATLGLGRALMLGAAALPVVVAAADMYQAQGIGPYGPTPPFPTNAAACIAGITKFFPTPAQACQAITGEIPNCDRNDASYRNFKWQLTSPSSCSVSWEYLNTGSTSWYAWGGTFPIYVCPDGWKARPSPMTGCAPVDQQNQAEQPHSCPAEGNPILPLVGAKRDQVQTGVALGNVELVLTYDSTIKAAPAGFVSSIQDPPSFGPLWRSNFHQKLVVVGSQSAYLSRGDGNVIYFQPAGGGFVATGTLAHRLKAVNGGYAFSNVSTGEVEVFDSSGRLLSLTGPGGMALRFSYDASKRLVRVQASDGRTLAFAYVNGLLAQITTPDYSRITATYDSQANLTSLTWPDGRSAGFLYEDANHPWALTGKVDENGARFATFAYNPAGRAVSTEYAGGVQRHSVSYGQPPILVIPDDTYDSAKDLWGRRMYWQAPGPVTVTDPGGATSTLEAQAVNGMPALTGRSQPAGSGCAATTRRQTFDAVGNVLSRDDFDGTRSCFVYDAANRETARVEGLPPSIACSDVTPASALLPLGARKTTTQWHPDWNFPVVVAGPLKKSIFVFNKQTDPTTGSVLSCSSAADRADGTAAPVLCKQIDVALDTKAQRITQFRWDGLGHVTTLTDPTGNTTQYAYYSDTALSGGDAFDPFMDSVVLLLHGSGPDGSQVITDASAVQRPVLAQGNAKISAAVSRFGGTSIAFDGAGDYLSTPYTADFALGSDNFTIETFLYKVGNSAGTSRIWNPNGDYYDGVNLAIDASGNFSVNASTSCNAWNYSLPIVTNLANGQWHHLALVRNGGSLLAFVNGSMYPVTTSLGVAALCTDTGHERVIGGQAGTDRPLNGFVDEFRITRGVARYTASFAPPTAEFPSTGATRQARGHRTGDLQRVRNAVGQTVQYTSYDPAGRVTQVVDAKGITTDNAYTPRGWLSSVTVTSAGGEPRITSYAYDGAGQIAGVTYPDGTSLAFGYDPAHRLTRVTDARGNAATYILDSAGNRVGEQFNDPNGVLRRTISRSFDALNRVQQVTGGAQ